MTFGAYRCASDADAHTERWLLKDDYYILRSHPYTGAVKKQTYFSM